MGSCLICNEALAPFISFGRMPIANGFLTADQFATEYFFDLEVGRCERCGMVQLINLVDPTMLFHDEYAYFSSISKRMSAHFKKFAGEIGRTYLTGFDPFVVEIGSNDGIMLGNFAKAGYRHLGIEPSKNVADAALAKGVNTVCRFFDEQLVDNILNQYGQADAFLGANVMCHIPDLHTVFAGVRRLLKDTGVFVFEDPYIGAILEKTSYDQIYDEHVYYFSLLSVSHIAQQHDLMVFDARPQPVHGGSMRYYLAPRGKRRKSNRVKLLTEKEIALGIHEQQTYRQLHDAIERSREGLINVLHKLKRQRKRVVGYGATSKSTTVTNYCGITPDLVEFVSDTTPGKQHKYTPGVHIPVKPYQDFVAHYPDVALLFAWNHAAEIMENEGAYRRAGGRWLTYVPEVSLA